MFLSSKLNPFKIFITVLLCIFLSACSTEEENEVSSMTSEEISQLAEDVAEGIQEDTALESQEYEIEYPLNTVGLPEFLKELEANAEVLENYNACPVSIFQKHKSYENYRDIGDSYEAQCAKNPADCLKQCFEDRNGSLCHDLAYILEGNEKEITPKYGRMIYAQACATGWALSCTNRGASIRNAMQEDDPFFEKDESETNLCLNTTFEKMCDENEEWGCYMTAVSHAEGEGREINEAKADEYYKRACAIELDSGACRE